MRADMNPWAMFDDRSDAGRRLAAELHRRAFADPIVLALPRGGVPVGAEIARKLDAPLDVLLVRKIGAPMQPELAVAAVIDGAEAETVINDEVAESIGATPEDIARWAAPELVEIERRRKLYFGGREPLGVAGKTAIMVDDGVATGATMRAALKGLRRRSPGRIVLAIPVAPAETVGMLRREADEVVCLASPADFGAIGIFYRDFHQLDDAEVLRILAEMQEGQSRAQDP